MMKTFQLEQVTQPSTENHRSNHIRISKRTVILMATLVAITAVITIPVAIYPIGAIALGWAVSYCYSMYQDIASLNFTDQNYSITLEEIIDDLNG